MINPRSRSLEWITEVAQKMGVRDKALMEKTIRAFSLLEALARSGCPFLFKGGSSLMLHLNTSKRLSIDIDIICPPQAPSSRITSANMLRNMALVRWNWLSESHAPMFPKSMPSSIMR